LLPALPLLSPRRQSGGKPPHSIDETLANSSEDEVAFSKYDGGMAATEEG